MSSCREKRLNRSTALQPN